MIKTGMIENYKDYGKCLSISNGVIEAYVTLDVGPRIIRFGYVGGQNVLSDIRSDYVPMTDEKYENFFGKGRAWDSMGGHRVWVTPESYPETYLPDDRPVDYSVFENTVVITPLADTQVGIAKSLTIKMDNDDANMMVTMDVKNISNSKKEFAVWAISVCAKGGNLIIPMNTNDTGYLHNRSVSVWPYTDMGDSRIGWGKKYVTIKQDVNATTPVKLGFDLNKGVTYYVLGEDVFSKRYDARHGELPYPDENCSFETYTNNVMIEIETLSDVKSVESGETHSLTEFWSLNKNQTKVDFKNEDSIDEFLNKM